MLIKGEWKLCEDGVIRPVVEAKVVGSDGQLHGDWFLIDSGADRTVFSTALWEKLSFPIDQASPGGASLIGISGPSAVVRLNTLIEFTSDDGREVRVRGEYSAFTDPAATDMSILGRDVLNNFDVIISKPRNDVLILSPNHHYNISRA